MFLLVVLSGTPNDAGFLLDAWKALSGYPDLQKYILSSAIKFVSVRSSSGKFQMQFNVLQSENYFLIPLSITLFNPKIVGFLFQRKIALPGEYNMKNILSKQRTFENCKRSSRNFKPSSNNRKFWAKLYLLLRTDILQTFTENNP